MKTAHEPQTARTPIDLPVVGRFALIGLALLALFAFSVGAPQLIELARWAGIPRAIAWLTPVVVDGALVVYSVAAAVQRARGERARLMWLALTAFTLLSVAAQVTHAMATGTAPTSPTYWVSVVLAGSLPFAVLIGVESAITVTTSAPLPRKKTHTTSTESVRPVASVERPKPAPKTPVEPAPKPESKPAPASEPKTPKPIKKKPTSERDQRIVELSESGLSSREVSAKLEDEGITVSPSTITRVLKKVA